MTRRRAANASRPRGLPRSPRWVPLAAAAAAVVLAGCGADVEGSPDAESNDGDADRSPTTSPTLRTGPDVGGCREVIPSDVIEGLGWSPTVRPPRSLVGGCVWRGEGGVISVIPGSRSVAGACAKLEEDAGSNSRFVGSPTWTDAACATEPVTGGAIGAYRVVVPGENDLGDAAAVEVAVVPDAAVALERIHQAQEALATLVQTD